MTDDTVDLFRRLTYVKLAEREREFQSGVDAILAEQAAKGLLKSGATLIRLRKRGEDDLKDRTNLLVESASQILADDPIETIEADARTCKSVVETILNSSYGQIWQQIAAVPYVRELLHFKLSSVPALQWHLAEVRNEQLDRANVAIDLIVRSRLAKHPRRATHRRKLVAIVSLDVVGYSARMEENEANATREVLELHALADSVAREHGGRVFNTAGDGIMMEFPSATDALEAADALAQRCELPVRVGVHVGDVSIDDRGDLFGHAVNIAARLMQAASEARVVVSVDAKRMTREPIAKRLGDYGLIEMKNIKESIEALILMPSAKR